VIMELKEFDELVKALEDRLITAMESKFLTWSAFRPYQIAICVMLAILLGINSLSMFGFKVDFKPPTVKQTTISVPG
jgi:hypothetical protein